MMRAQGTNARVTAPSRIPQAKRQQRRVLQRAAKLGGRAIEHGDAAQVFDVRTLEVGCHGEDVTDLQSMLITAGHYSHAEGPTGYFGAYTKQCLEAWQTAAGLPVTGVTGASLSAAHTAPVASFRQTTASKATHTVVRAAATPPSATARPRLSDGQAAMHLLLAGAAMLLTAVVLEPAQQALKRLRARPPLAPAAAASSEASTLEASMLQEVAPLVGAQSVRDAVTAGSLPCATDAPSPPLTHPTSPPAMPQRRSAAAQHAPPQRLNSQGNQVSARANVTPGPRKTVHLATSSNVRAATTATDSATLIPPSYDPFSPHSSERRRSDSSSGSIMSDAVHASAELAAAHATTTPRFALYSITPLAAMANNAAWLQYDAYPDHTPYVPPLYSHARITPAQARARPLPVASPLHPTPAAAVLSMLLEQDAAQLVIQDLQIRAKDLHAQATLAALSARTTQRDSSDSHIETRAVESAAAAPVVHSLPVAMPAVVAAVSDAQPVGASAAASVVHSLPEPVLAASSVVHSLPEAMEAALPETMVAPGPGAQTGGERVVYTLVWPSDGSASKWRENPAQRSIWRSWERCHERAQLEARALQTSSHLADCFTLAAAQPAALPHACTTATLLSESSSLNVEVPSVGDVAHDGLVRSASPMQQQRRSAHAGNDAGLAPQPASGSKRMPHGLYGKADRATSINSAESSPLPELSRDLTLGELRSREEAGVMA